MKNIFQHGAKLWKPFSLFLLLAISFSYAMFQGGFVSWFLFYSFLPFALYALYLLFVSLQSFTAHRHLSKREYFAHDDLTVTIHVKRKHSFLLLFIIVEDLLNQTMQNAVKDKTNKTIYFLGFKREFSFQYDIVNLPRGEHEFPSIRIMTCDLLGMIEREERIGMTERILVSPTYKDYLHVPVNKFLEQGKVLRGGRAQRETSSVVGIREYQQGDRYSWIHWKASAKRDGLVTKEFEHQSSTNALIILDSSPTDRFESMVSFTASLGQILLYKGTQIGFLTFNEESVSMPIQSGESCRQQFFYHLAQIQPNSSKPFEKIIVEERLFMQKENTLLLVTSKVTESLIEATNKRVAGKSPVILFVMETENGSVNSTMQSLKLMARSYGIVVVYIREGQDSSGLMEVNRA